MPTKVKICGITNLEDALLSYQLGADMLGLIFAESPRRVSITAAADIASRLSGKIVLIGVFSDPEDPFISEVCEEVKLDMLQLYFPENANGFSSYLLPVLRSYWINENTDVSKIKMAGSLLDFKKAPRLLGLCASENIDMSETILAGGLNCENVGRIVKTFKPNGVDVARGVESEPGRKDKNKLEQFIQKVKS
ncbi:MAG: phosphoribosylanthranilate isomerase [candidate division Zixibacteria bacterium]